MKPASQKWSCLISRREFLFASALTVSTTMIPLSISASQTQQIPAKVGTHPKRVIATLDELKAEQPLFFNYPEEGLYMNNMLFKLERPAGGGIGLDKDIVAFNATCTHRGGALNTVYKPENVSLGPCPLHLSSFDLTRHGILITGMATESLPQILLELDGNDIIATGVLGLIYGHHTNEGNNE